MEKKQIELNKMDLKTEALDLLTKKFPDAMVSQDDRYVKGYRPQDNGYTVDLVKIQFCNKATIKLTFRSTKKGIVFTIDSFNAGTVDVLSILATVSQL